MSVKQYHLFIMVFGVKNGNIILKEIRDILRSNKVIMTGAANNKVQKNVPGKDNILNDLSSFCNTLPQFGLFSYKEILNSCRKIDSIFEFTREIFGLDN